MKSIANVRGHLLVVVVGLSLTLCFAAGNALAETIVLESNATTQGAGISSGAPSNATVTVLDDGDTSGLTFSAVDLGASGSAITIPSSSPTGTMIVNIAPGDGENGFFMTTFVLPGDYSAISLVGVGNVDDFGRVFLNGNAISPAITSGNGNKLSETGDSTFFTTDAAYFQPGTNVLLISDDNSMGGPSAAAYYARVNFTVPAAVPEPASWALLLAGLGLHSLRRLRDRLA